jgi:PAS domain S-box-containing protein
MSEKRRILLLAFIMAGACIAVAGTVIIMLYRVSFHEQREVLVAMAKSQARFIEAIAQFNDKFGSDHPGGFEDATLDQIIEAHRQHKGIGETGEFTLAKREGNNIVFLLRHRHYDTDKPKPVRMDSKLAEPMRLALSGLSGTVIGFDYRGERVLAAYESIANLNWGVVAKVDLAELRTPFLRAGFMAVAITIVVILVGSFAFFYVTNPILGRLREDALHLNRLVESLRESEKNLQQAHDAMETRVRLRTAELASANQKLENQMRERMRAEKRLRALWEIAEMVDSEYQELCDRVLENTLEMTQSQYAFYGFLNSSESILSIYAWSKNATEDCRMQERPIEFPIAQAGIWANAIRERRVFVVNDYKADHPGKRGLPEDHIPLTRILALPIFNQGRIVAVAVAANKPSDYEGEDIKQLAAFASGVQVIIDHRKTESELRESEKKYGAVVENSLTGIYIILNGEIVFANPRFAEIFGYSKDEILGMESRMLVQPEERDLYDEIEQKRLDGVEAPLQYEIKGVKKNGEAIWTSRRHVIIDYQGSRALLGNVVDVTQRKQMEESLIKSENECRLLSRKVIEAEEDERKRIAREIHDGLGQSLAAIKFRVESCSLTAGEEAFSGADELRSIIKMIQGSMEEMRRIHNDLHPAHIDELGIVKTISYFCGEFRATYPGISLETKIDFSEDEVPEYLKTPIYRIFQEAMHNAANHSEAKHISFRLDRTADTINLAVEDNGIGFATGKDIDFDKSHIGLGLFSMRERAALSGGSLQIESAPGKGTFIAATWPLGDAP